MRALGSDQLSQDSCSRDDCHVDDVNRSGAIVDFVQDADTAQMEQVDACGAPRDGVVGVRLTGQVGDGLARTSE